MLKLKRVRLKDCVECGFPVSGGGNIHAVGHHVVRVRNGERWRHRKSREKARKQLVADMAGVIRGVAVKGTSGSKAATHRAGRKLSVSVKK